MAQQSPEAAAAVAGLVEEIEPSAPPTDAPQEAEEVVEQENEESELDLSPELPDDLAQELAGPEDFNFEPEPVYEEEQGEDEYEDPAVTAERNKRVALEKKLAWMEEQNLNAQRERWVEKDSKYFPLVNTREIATQSKSRREFARKAKAENDRLRPIVEGYLEAERKKVQTQVKSKEQEMADAWGTPSAGPGYVPAEATDMADAVEKIHKATNLRDKVKARLNAGLQL